MRDDSDITPENLGAIEGPNVPCDIEGYKSGGPHQIVSAEERRARRTSILNLMAIGKSDDFIFESLEREYGISKTEFYRLKKEAFARLAKEGNERRPHLRDLARSRIYKHIEEASSVAQFQAVASLEKTLSAIEGTEDKEEAIGPADERQLAALMRVIGQMSPDEITVRIELTRKKMMDERLEELPEADAHLIIEAEKVEDEDDDE
jgi:hypothetical protein